MNRADHEVGDGSLLSPRQRVGQADRTPAPEIPAQRSAPRPVVRANRQAWSVTNGDLRMAALEHALDAVTGMRAQLIKRTPRFVFVRRAAFSK